MFDTMTLTKITAAICSAALIYLLGTWAAELIFHPDSGHGDEHEQAYVVDTGEEKVAEVEDVAEEGPSFAEMLASADAAKGANVFRKCGACHKIEDGANGAGPHLWGVVGRDIGSVDGFSYSGSLVAKAKVWTPENLDGFLEKPRSWAPGTTMGFSGLKKPEDRVNVIAYLQSASN